VARHSARTSWRQRCWNSSRNQARHGPATDNGFFYDVYREVPFRKRPRAIELKMAEVVARDEPFVQILEPRDQALADYKANAEFMKIHFIERFTQPATRFRSTAMALHRLLPRPARPSTGRVRPSR